MKLTQIKLLAVAASIALPSLASAQSTVTEYWAGTPKTVASADGHRVGPYSASATANLANPFDIFCVDFDNSAPAAGGSWTSYNATFAQAVNNTTIVAGGNTNFYALNRILGPKIYQSSTGSYVNGTSGVAGDYMHDLRAAAYLSSLFTTQNKTDGYWDDIHGAIWSLFSQNFSGAQYGNWQTYRTQAFNYIDKPENSTFGDGYHVLIDANAYNSNYSFALTQVFITEPGVGPQSVVPEPSTYALFAAGLVGIAFARRRRNKKGVVVA